jgi:hypothetical protein
LGEDAGRGAPGSGGPRRFGITLRAARRQRNPGAARVACRVPPAAKPCRP